MVVAEEKEEKQATSEEKENLDFDLEIDDISFVKDLNSLLEQEQKE
jgi:hypothetical protein